MEAAVGGMFLLMGTMFAVTFGSIALWVWALVDAIRVEYDWMYQAGTKLIWVLVIVVGGPLGALVYLMVGRPKSVRA